MEGAASPRRARWATRAGASISAGGMPSPEERQPRAATSSLQFALRGAPSGRMMVVRARGTTTTASGGRRRGSRPGSSCRPAHAAAPAFASSTIVASQQLWHAQDDAPEQELHAGSLLAGLATLQQQAWPRQRPPVAAAQCRHNEDLEQQQQQNHRPPDVLAKLLGAFNQAKLLVAGAASAVVSRTAMAPLERVKMELLLRSSGLTAAQTAAWVWQREGLLGFYKGNAINLLRTAPFKALNFFSFDLYSSALEVAMRDGGNTARLIAGALAGITATLVCFPLDVLRTRLMAQAPAARRYGGPLRTLQGMARFEGLGALYAGCLPAVVGMAPSGAIYYATYHSLKSRHLEQLAQQQQQPELPVAYTLLYGALAGAAAEAFLYPLETVRRKLQLQSMAAGAAAAAPAATRQAGGGAGALGRVAATCAGILRAEGPRGFYAGMLPSMLQVLPSSALSYSTYEAVKAALCGPPL